MFANLRSPKFPRNGLAISETSLSVARSERGQGTLRVKQRADVTLFGSTVDAGFTNQNLDLPALEEAVRECAERAGLADRKNWGLALPHGTAKFASITLDSEPKSKREFQEILEWKAGSAFGLESGYLRLAADRISNDVDGKTRYLVTAVCKDVLAEYEELVARLAWNVGLILPRSLAESAVLSTVNQGDSLLLSFSAEGFNGMVFRGADPLVVRHVTCAEEEIADELYRLVLFYSDRFGNGDGGILNRFLATGTPFDLESISEVCGQALGYSPETLDGAIIGMEYDLGSSESAVAAVGISAIAG